jgi:hypothetical protein
MSNISTLTNAGLITSGTVFSPADVTTIENLSTDEVNALISVYNQVGLSFLARNCGPNPAPGPGHPIGIVF